MTYSIVAVDLPRRLLGIGVVSGSIAAGSRVPWGKAGVAAVATQAFTNPLLGKWIIEYISEGLSPDESILKALKRDGNPELRQVAVVDLLGRVSVYGGRSIPQPSLEIEEKGYACIGNLLSTKRVVRSMCEAFKSKNKLPFPERLLHSLEAGHEEGGDARGDRSSALLVLGEHPLYGLEYGKLVDIRVDMSEEPVKGLYAIYFALAKS